MDWPTMAPKNSGRDLSLMDFVEFNEEYARHGTGTQAILVKHMAPTILAYEHKHKKSAPPG